MNDELVETVLFIGLVDARQIVDGALVDLGDATDSSVIVGYAVLVLQRFRNIF